jgi:hypothetical protein
MFVLFMKLGLGNTTESEIPVPTPTQSIDWYVKDILTTHAVATKLTVVSVVLLAGVVCVCLWYVISFVGHLDDQPLLQEWFGS